MNAQDIINVLDTLTAKLQGPAAHVWELAVRQQYIMGLTYLAIWLVISLVSITCLVYGLRRYWRRTKALRTERNGYLNSYEREPDVIEFTFFCIAAIGLVVILVIGIIGTPSLVTMLLNPEWAALQSVSGLVPK